MAYRTEIERALNEMISDETGMRFQGLAVVHGQKKWPQLVACERHWDGGLDAHAKGALQQDGKGIGLASSITGTLEKIASDSVEVKKHYPDVQTLIFSTPVKVSKHTEALWAKEILDNFGLQLVVVSREEFISWLRAPAQSDICRDQLGIAPSTARDLEPQILRAQEAANEVVKEWDSTYRKEGRPLINLSAVKLDDRGNPVEAVTIASLGAALTEGRRMILEGPAGSGKTTTMVQLAQYILSTGGLPFLVEIPEWVSSHRDVLSFAAEYAPFAERGIDANLLSQLRGRQPLTFLLNGWNEVSIAAVQAADAAVRDLERKFPAANIIIATRIHRLIPPLREAFRVELNPLEHVQRNEYLDLALGESAHGLRVKLDNSRMLHTITRTPLILAEVVDLYRSGKEIPPTKMGVLGAVMEELEQSTKHRTALQQAPLRGHATDYLRTLSMRMTERGETTIAETDARAIVNSVSETLRTAGQIASLPDPAEILDELSNRHVLVRARQDEVTYRFQHQQFQEFYAARGLGALLANLVSHKDANEGKEFLVSYVNEPRWGESLRMLAEDIGARSSEKKFVELGCKLVRMGLEVDPIFAGEVARWCGPAIWSEVRNEMGVLLRAWHATPDSNHQNCALAAMLATGSDDFKDILVPLLTASNDQVRLAVYHSGAELLPSSLGANWSEIVYGWPEDVRLDFILQLANDPWLSETVEQFALADPSTKVKWNVARMLSWYGYTEKVEQLLAPLDDGGFREAVRSLHLDEIPQSLWPRVASTYEQMYVEATDAFERLRFLHVLQGFGGTKIVERMKAELDGLGPDQLKRGKMKGKLNGRSMNCKSPIRTGSANALPGRCWTSPLGSARGMV